MTPDMQVGAALRRIAAATSVIRTRTQDDERRSAHGGRNGDLAGRTRLLVEKLEAVADQLEKAIT